LEQHSVPAVQALEGPLQKVGVLHTLPLQTPEQHTPPLVVLQAVPSDKHRLPGPPSLPASVPRPPSSPGPPSSLVVLFPPQLHAEKVYPTTSAAKKARVDFFIRALQIESS